MSVSLLAALLVTLALLVISLVGVLNALTFPRLDWTVREHAAASQGKVGDKDRLPAVSLLVPARDEAAVIGGTVRGLLGQDYPDLEILVLDDGSTDSTAEAARCAAAGDPRLRVLPGAPLPPGWLGKNWACHQLAEAAGGELLLFTDADVRWEAGALSALVAQFLRERADLLTVWPTQETVTWGERLVVPLMAFSIVGYLPLLAVHHLRWPVFAAANGQCLLFERQAYTRIGGHAAVRGDIVEDMGLARRIKASGLRLRMADGAGLIACRMYAGWPAVRLGFAKNILAGHGGRPVFLLLSTLFHWLAFAAPWAWLALGWLAPRWPGGLATPWPLWPLALVLLGVGARLLSAAVTRQRLADALLLPVSVALMTVIAAQAIWWQWRYGGPQWKGRRYRPGEQGIREAQPLGSSAQGLRSNPGLGRSDEYSQLPRQANHHEGEAGR